MSKDFEQAYKELMQSEAPDLWDRIEAGLKSKSAPEEVVQKQTNTKKKKIIVLRRYSGVIAAVVCMAVIIPASILIRQTSKGYSASDTTEAAEEGIEETADSGAGAAVPMNETAAAPADEALSGGIMEEAGTPQESESGSGERALDEAVSEDTAADVADERQMQAEKSKMDFSMAKESALALQEAEEDRTSEGTVFEHVVVKVTGMKEINYGESDRESYGGLYEDGSEQPGILYVGNLQQDMDGLEAGEQITICVPESSSITLFKDGVFEIDLESRSKEEGFYVLAGYHQEIK